MLVRKCGTSVYADASRLVLGVFEVKGSWQLKLDGNMSLQAALADENLGPSVAKVIQQVSAGARWYVAFHFPSVVNEGMKEVGGRGRGRRERYAQMLVYGGLPLGWVSPFLAAHMVCAAWYCITTPAAGLWRCGHG
jgi:hypothetical protein